MAECLKQKMSWVDESWKIINARLFSFFFFTLKDCFCNENNTEFKMLWWHSLSLAS